ncbi:MAG: leucine--tRNA ligase [Spirochaetia bacterium]
MAKYPFLEIEQKWQTFWAQHKTFCAKEDSAFPVEKRAYILDMFPYPSGAGLHVGHPEGYTATDIFARYLRANGYNVLHPMGFDSFGLPAENYAIQTGQPPRVTTEENIKNFRKQIQRLGFSYDWDREVSTHDPSYYRWTQWIFLQLYKKGLAYESDMPINWCESCLTGLANEEVSAQGHCDRCGTAVVRKRIRQWVLKITAYADRLLDELETLDWPESLKAMQRHWIGRSEGCHVDFSIEQSEEKITVYTTRADTLFGVTYLVLAPESSLVKKILTTEQSASVLGYIEKSAKKSDMERTQIAKEKTGVFTGSYAIHPLTKSRIPVWISDYVLLEYGTGAVMAVPAHDERDFEFAQKYALPIKYVVVPEDQSLCNGCFSELGVCIESDFLNGKKSIDAQKTMYEYLENSHCGRRAVNYRLRDWIFSRQRYWGEPIPIVHCQVCGNVPVPEDQLPLTLPNVDQYQPSGTGESPLSLIDEWVECACPQCGQDAKRETNTMPQWAGSCWYYFRYIDPHNENTFCQRNKADYWLPVSLYIGGAEHAVLHLLYARFWHKVLFDLGLVTHPEPFRRLINQGMILGENHQKMSKSLGNVVNPDDMIDQYGADALRIYEMFMGPLEITKPWNTQGLAGVSRFLMRVYEIAHRPISSEVAPPTLIQLLHKTIKKVTQDTAALELNTAISQMMIFINEVFKHNVCYQDLWLPFVQILAPYAPHLAEEMWQTMGQSASVCYAPWPAFDPSLAQDKDITLGVQINGKLRAEITVEKGSSKEVLEKMALALPKIQDALDGKSPSKIIAVPDRIVNIVVK